MTPEDFSAVLQDRLRGYFDIQENAVRGGRRFAFIADFSFTSNQTVLTKNHVVDFFSSRERILFSVEPDFSGAQADDALADACREALALAEPSRNHKSTVVTRVFAVPSFSSEAERKEVRKRIRRFRFFHSHFFLLHGFSEARAVLADFSPDADRSFSLVCSPAAKSCKQLFTPEVRHGKEKEEER